MVKVGDVPAAGGLVLVVGGDLRQGRSGCAGCDATPSSSRRASGPAARSTISTTASARAPRDPMSAVFAAAMREWRRSAAQGPRRQHRRCAPVCRSASSGSMHVTSSREMERLERFMPFLATVGSTAPFVGLFGTVWGIMNSFQSIAACEEHQPRGGGAGHRRSAVRHRPRPGRGDPRGHRLQQVLDRFRPLCRPARRASPPSSAPSCRASSTRRPEPWRWTSSLQRGGGGRRAALPADGRDQRHADGGRDAGAAGHLHGDGAAAHRRRAGGSAARPRRRRSPSRRSRWSSPSTPQGKIFLQNSAGRAIDELAPRLQAITKSNPDTDIYVRGDRAINYGRVMEVMGMVSARGLQQGVAHHRAAADETSAKH